MELGDFGVNLRGKGTSKRKLLERRKEKKSFPLEGALAECGQYVPGEKLNRGEQRDHGEGFKREQRLRGGSHWIG